MRFLFTAEEDAFRTEVEEFLNRELPPDWEEHEGLIDVDEPQGLAFARDFHKKLADRGWLTIAWPRKYGGQGASFMKQVILKETVAYRGAPGVGGAVNMLGPILMRFGTTRQKKQYLPAIAEARWVWAQGYSEPGHGSDLANLETRAEERGAYFVLNGSKIWGHLHADMMFLLARTDPEAPKHKGISFFLLDLKSPGVTVTPVPMMWRGSKALVTFDNVRVPRSNLVGDKGMGWYIGAALLDLERSGVEMYGKQRRLMDLLVKYGKETPYQSGSLLDQSGVRSELIDCYIETEVLRLICYNIAWIQSQGQIPSKEASICKIFGRELLKRSYQLGMRMLGSLAQMEPGSKWTPLNGSILRGYLDSYAETVAGGTSEINRNVIASRGLGLPRN